MKRKTAIARALLHDPGLLILDEPNSGLDPLTALFILDYLKKLKSEGKTIVLSAHNLFHVESICDRVAIIKNGRMLVFDRMEAIRARLGKREYQVIFRADKCWNTSGWMAIMSTGRIKSGHHQHARNGLAE